MIPGWLTPSERLAFLSGSFGRQPYARAGAAHSATRLLNWTTLDAVLGIALASNVLTVKGGQLTNSPIPRSSSEVRALMAQGISTVVQASEYYDQGLQELADAFARLLPGKVHVQLYATPGGAHSYGWHYDFEDVFIAQTLGVKDYYLRDNTVARHTRVGQRLDFTCIRAETSKLMSARLITGDWLYIPHRWWHLVKCVDSALSISVGIMPRS